MILLIAGVDILFVRKNTKFNLDDAVFWKKILSVLTTSEKNFSNIKTCLRLKYIVIWKYENVAFVLG